MSTASLRPILRPSTLPSLPSSASTSTFRSTAPIPNTTYICSSCRHARLLRRPKRPYTFTQLVTLSDGSAFTMRTTSPLPVYRSTRDTRNAPLWNPSNRDLLNVEDDEAGRLAGFRARFGTGFDAQREAAAIGLDETVVEQLDAENKGSDLPEQSLDGGVQQGAFFRPATETKHNKGSQLDDDYYEFEEDDANLLDLISSYGQEVKAGKEPPPVVTKKGKK